MPSCRYRGSSVTLFDLYLTWVAEPTSGPVPVISVSAGSRLYPYSFSPDVQVNDIRWASKP